MSIDVRKIAPQSDEYKRCIDRSPQSTIFHDSDFLKLMAKHSDTELTILAGFKGQEPVGVFPFYREKKWMMNIVYSPPPGCGVAYLGPVLLNFEKLKRRKVERRHKAFVEGCIQWINDEISPEYVRVRTTTDYNDSRPFQWKNTKSSPRYTYGLNLNSDEEEIKQSFSKSLRRYLDPDGDQSIEVNVGGEKEIEFVYGQINARYEAQDKTYPLTESFVKDVYDVLPSERVQPYVGRVEGELTAGIITLEDESASYFWQGGGKPDTEYPINDLLHWQIIRDSIESDLDYYDLYGANTERICKYKAKFNSSLQEYYELERDTPVSKLYKLIQ